MHLLALIAVAYVAVSFALCGCWIAFVEVTLALRAGGPLMSRTAPQR